MSISFSKSLYKSTKIFEHIPWSYTVYQGACWMRHRLHQSSCRWASDHLAGCHAPNRKAPSKHCRSGHRPDLKCAKGLKRHVAWLVAWCFMVCFVAWRIGETRGIHRLWISHDTSSIRVATNWNPLVRNMDLEQRKDAGPCRTSSERSMATEYGIMGVYLKKVSNQWVLVHFPSSRGGRKWGSPDFNTHSGLSLMSVNKPIHLWLNTHTHKHITYKNTHTTPGSTNKRSP